MWDIIRKSYICKENTPLRLYYAVLTLLIPLNVFTLGYEILHIVQGTVPQLWLYLLLDVAILAVLSTAFIGLLRFKKYGYYAINTVLVFSLLHTMYLIIHGVHQTYYVQVIVSFMQALLLLVYFYKRRLILN